MFVLAHFFESLILIGNLENFHYINNEKKQQEIPGNDADILTAVTIAIFGVVFT